MSEDATQQLLAAQVDRLISMAALTNETLHQLNGRLENIERQQAEFSARLDHFEKQQAEFSARLESLETKVDQRLHDTRPIWENVQTQLSDLRRESAEFRSETSSGFRAVDRKIGALSKNLVDMTAEMQELREMVEKLDAQPA